MRTLLFLCALWFAGLIILSGCGEKTVALVNTKPIGEKEFKKAARAAEPEILDSLIIRELVLQQGKKEGITVTDKEILEELKRRRDANPFLRQELKLRGLTLEDLKSQIRYDLTFWKLQTKDIKPTEQDLRTYFRIYRALWDVPELVRVSQIVVEEEKEAKKIREDLLKGENFEGLALAKSTDTETKARGGDAGYMPLRDLAARLRQPAESLKPGFLSQPIRISDPVTGKKAYLIIKITERKPGKPAQFEKVKESVKRAFLADLAHRTNRAEIVLAQCRRNAKVKIFLTRYKELEKKYYVPPKPEEVWKKGKG